MQSSGDMVDLLVWAVVGAVGAGAVVTLSAYLRPQWAHEGWARAAAELGLELEPSATGAEVMRRMIGERGGVKVRVGIRVGIAGYHKSRRKVWRSYVEAQLPRPLGLGLGVSPSTWLIEELVGGDLTIGHPEVDSAYRIVASSSEQARRLLCTPSVLAPLRFLSKATFRPHLSDTLVKLEARGSVMSPDVLRGVVDQAVELVRRVDSARAALGPSDAARVIESAWRALADARGLVLDADRLTMSGRSEGVHVEVVARQHCDAYTTTFAVRFDRPLGIALSLEFQSGLDQLAALIGMDDIHTGDAAFDARFIVRGRPAGAVCAALTPDVRARLVRLQASASHLIVEDDHLRAEVAWLVDDPGHLAAAITAIAQAGALLSGVAEPEGAGPYRA